MATYDQKFGIKMTTRAWNFFKKVDFDQNILEVTIVKNFEKWLVYSFKMTSLGHVAFFDKTTIFCSIFVRKKKIQKSCWSIRLWVF